jgi:hypothetical protein
MIKKLKIIMVSFILIGGVFLVINFSKAAGYGTEETRNATGNLLPSTIAGVKAGPDALPLLIGAVVEIILSVVGIVFFVLILYAGFNWMTARGNSEKIDKSKETIESALVGLIVVLAAYAITNFIFSNLGTGGSEVNPDQACITAKGVCGPSAACVAPGTIQPGLCSGGVDNVCCLP